MSGDRNLQVAGMERDWPEGRGIFHNEAKTVLLAVSRLLVTQSRPSLARTSLWMSDMATSTLAPPIYELACAPACTLTCLAGLRRVYLPCRRDVRSWPSSPEEPGASLVAKPASLMTSPTSIVWDTLRSSWSRSWLTVLTLCTRRTLSFRRSMASKPQRLETTTIGIQTSSPGSIHLDATLRLIYTGRHTPK